MKNPNKKKKNKKKIQIIYDDVFFQIMGLFICNLIKYVSFCI
jgi:hypothetical protein